MRPEACALAFAATIGAVASPATARAAGWEIEIHGGGMLTVRPSRGDVTSPPQGTTFETVVPGVSSRRVSSWYVGGGGDLIARDEIRTTTWGGSTWQSVVTVRPMHGVTSSAAVQWPLRGGAGVRLGRRLSSRLTVEANLDYGRHSPVFTERALESIEDGRASFESAWSGTLSSQPGARVTSQANVTQGAGHQLLAIGLLNVNLHTGDAPKWSRRSPRRRFVSYLTFGGGIVSTTGEEASATFVGRYQFAAPSGASDAPFEETDTATVRSRTFGTSLVGVLGAGWKQDVTTRWGLRLDARAYVRRNPTRILVDARPSVRSGSPAGAAVVQSRIGAIQFVNDSSGAYAGHESSLSGPAIEGFETFRGTGLQIQLAVTLGWFLRF